MVCVLKSTNTGHLQLVWRLVVLKNGDLVSASSGANIRVWNSSQGANWALIKTWQAHTSLIRALLVLDNC
jgi:hypothetical protein